MTTTILTSSSTCLGDAVLISAAAVAHGEGVSSTPGANTTGPLEAMPGQRSGSVIATPSAMRAIRHRGRGGQAVALRPSAGIIEPSRAFMSPRLDTAPLDVVPGRRPRAGLRPQWRVIAVCALCFALSASVISAQTIDLEQGKRLFESQCGSCHGPLGNGGKGANLAQPRLRRATDDQALSNIIRRGISGTEMPGSPLTPSQVSSIAAYVKTLGRVAPEGIPGDRGRGETLYAGLDCARCHTVGGRGGIVGPGLDDIGVRRSAAHLREALLSPEASVPGGFLQLRVVTRGGGVLTGIRVNEDAFSIQLRDLSGRLHSFWKDELDLIEPQWRRSPMTSYESRLTAEQTDDLVAYLVALKGDGSE
jgi:cytochrome c oxidase cbb3-type subunit 3